MGSKIAVSRPANTDIHESACWIDLNDLEEEYLEIDSNAFFFIALDTVFRGILSGDIFTTLRMSQLERSDFANKGDVWIE